MIGDRSHDILGARANKVRSRGVLWGYGTRDELLEAGADGLYEAVAELVSDLTAPPYASGG
jgi:phosphoglycolate phosphatase